MKVITRVTAGLASVAAAVVLGPVTPAYAGIVPDGYRFDVRQHYGQWQAGEVLVTEEIELFYDAAFNVVKVRGHGLAEKGVAAPTRLQVDFVRLGATQGAAGVVAERTTPVNSGTAASIAAVTPWIPVKAADVGCQEQKFQVRVGYSIRWADGTLSKFSVLSNTTSEYYCRP